MDCTNCRFNSLDGCRLEFCFFDDTEWKLDKEKVRVRCILCNSEFSIDAKSNQTICPGCVAKLRGLIKYD